MSKSKVEKLVEGNEEKRVRALFKETLWTDLGVLESGRVYEIPESRFAEWEKSGFCRKPD